MSRVIAAAAINELRDSHYVLNPVTGLYERAMLIEKASTNLVLQSENFGTTWVATGTPTRVAAAHTASGVTLDLFGDDSGASSEYYSQVITFTGNGAKALSVFVKAGTILSGSGSQIVLTDSTAAANRLVATITWSAGIPSVVASTGTYLGKELIVDGVYRLYFVTTSVTAANINALRIEAAFIAAEQGNIYAGGVQAENSLYPTSYVKTTTGTVTRNADSLYYPYTDVPQELTMYVKGIERGSSRDSSGVPGVVAIGGSSNASFYIWNNSSVYEAVHLVGSAVVSTAGVQPAWGDTVELRAVLSPSGTVTLGQAINGAAEVVASTSGALALAPTWFAQRIYIGDRNGALGAFAFLAVKVARGTKTLDEMRAMASMETAVLILDAGATDAITIVATRAAKGQPEAIGQDSRAFAGNLRNSRRSGKRQFQLTGALVTMAQELAIQRKIANGAQINCSGALLDFDTVLCEVECPTSEMITSTNLFRMTLTGSEV